MRLSTRAHRGILLFRNGHSILNVAENLGREEK